MTPRDDLTTATITAIDIYETPFGSLYGTPATIVNWKLDRTAHVPAHDPLWDLIYPPL